MGAAGHGSKVVLEGSGTNIPLRASIVNATEFRYAPARLHLYQSVVVIVFCGVPAAIIAAGVGSALGVAAGAGAVLPFAVAAVAGLRRAFRLELVAAPAGISIRNYWRSWDLSWDEVTDVGLGKQMLGFVPQTAVAFRTRAGAVARAQATPSRAPERSALLSVLRRLAPSGVAFHLTQ